MEYISTKELAERWNISITRIVVMAKKGQLKGAKVIGKSWVFPNDIEKPVDGRRKKEINISDDNFHFPFILQSNHPINELSNEEIFYQEAEKSYFRLEMEDAYLQFKTILNTTKNISLKCGCYFYLCNICGFLKRTNETFYYFDSFKELFNTNIPNKKEISLIYYEIITVVVNNSSVDFSLNEYYDCNNDTIFELILGKSYSALINYVSDKKPFDIDAFELLYMTYPDDKYPLFKTYAHVHLTLLNGVIGNTERQIYHLKKALSLAKKYNYLMCLVIYYHFLQKSISSIDYDDKEFINKITKYNILYTEGLRDISRHMFLKDLPEITQDDFEYLSYLYNNISTKEIAEQKGVSQQTVCNRLKTLRNKFNVEKNSDLVEKYRLYMLNRNESE